MKKIVLTAINAKYIHSNLAVYSLKAYARFFLQEPEYKKERPKIEIAEYTINQPADDILMDLYKRTPDMICLSCYIWNISYIETVIREIKKLLPETELWLGGPEVSFNAAEMLKRFPQVTGIMKGEGEATFAALVCGEPRETLDGITWRNQKGDIEEHPWREVLDLSSIPFVYEDMEDFANKIIYYESSRGCPFSCSYCLSSIDKRLRFRDIGLVKKELQFFMDQEVPQVKFVDRTFNCNHRHAMEIWTYLKEHDNGVTNFHFEISADLLNEEEIALIQTMRPGLIQLEIGVQSTNIQTVGEIHRTMRFEKVAENVGKIRKVGNIHQHLDLIAGLPWEDIHSFARSYDDVYALKPQQLQLGFLKVLKGSYMEEHAGEYGLVYKDTPPYEVLYTKWLSYGDVLLLKGVEEMTEVYYNSGQFTNTLEALEEKYASPFALYRDMADHYEKRGAFKVQYSRAARYELLLGFIKEAFPAEEGIFRELLTYDYYLRENAKSRPDFAKEVKPGPEETRRFYEQEEKSRRYLPGYEAYSKNQIRRMTHLEYFPRTKGLVLFDYANRDALTKEARTIQVEMPGKT